MALTKLPSIRTPLNGDGVWLVPVSKVLQLGCLLNACQNPKCGCTELMVSAYSLDERVRQFGFQKGKLVSTSTSLDDRPTEPDRALAFRLDVYTGELTGDGSAPLDLQERRMAAIVDALDGETLDELEAVWRKQKGIASRDGERIGKLAALEPGELTYWDAMFEVDRLEMFMDAGRRVVALDMYCTSAACDCRQVVISFQEEEVPERDDPPPIGLITAGFDGRVRFQPKTPEDEARLRALWARYRRRHPELRMLRERYEKLRTSVADDAAKALPATRSSSPAPDVDRAWTGAPELAVADSSTPTLKENSARAWVSTSRKRNKAAQRA